MGVRPGLDVAAVGEGQKLELGGDLHSNQIIFLASFNSNDTQDLLSSYYGHGPIPGISANYLILFSNEPFEVGVSI